MTNEMPPIGQRVLYRLADGRARVDKTVHAGVPDDVPSCVRRFDLPYQATGAWAPLPAVDDPRWRPYPAVTPGWCEEVLCYGICWDDQKKTFIAVDRPHREPLAFPGFAGGPPTPDWGVRATMTLADAFRDERTPPDDFMRKQTFSAWRTKEHNLFVAAEAENIYLSFINDGKTYAALTPLLKSTDLKLRRHIRTLINRLFPQHERDYGVWHDAVKQAIDDITFYYRKIHA